MERFSFKMPDLGEGIVEVELLLWNITVGDDVIKDQPIADVMTDKANVELTAPVSGRVLKLGGQVDELIAVGAELVLFEVSDSEESSSEENLTITESAHSKAQSAEVTEEKRVEKTKPCIPGEPAKLISQEIGQQESKIENRQQVKSKALASPAVRRRARELGIDLGLVAGSGSAGQVTRDDLNRLTSSAGFSGIQQRSSVEQIKLTGLRRVIARNMQRSTQTIPHFSYIEEVDLTELEQLRNHLNSQRGDNPLKLTLLPFIMQAMIQAIDHYPQVNATFDDESGIMSRYAAVHIGVATQTEQGLKVPVIRHAEALDLWGKAQAILTLSEASRDNSINTDDLRGSTITVTSMGRLGGLASTPILNKPEVAIIGINRAQDRVVVREGEMIIRRMMNLSSSFDHRIIDGFVAAEFIQSVRGFLEHPVTLFLPENRA